MDFLRKAFLVLAFAGLSATALSGCSNTAEGVGKDTERTGEYIQRKVN